MRHYVNEIVNTLLPENVKALNYNVFEEKVTFRQVEDAVSMYPAFSERRVVVVRRAIFSKAGRSSSITMSFSDPFPVIYA